MTLSTKFSSFYDYVFTCPPKLDTSCKIEKNAESVLQLRYYMDLPKGKKETSFSQLCRRVSRVVASGEYSKDGHNEFSYIQNIEKSIYNDMMSHRFLFNSPALFSAGTGLSSDDKLSSLLYSNEIELKDYETLIENMSKNQMMFACFTVSVPDSIEGIFDSVKNAAIISKFGGGVGANFGNLRESEAPIAGGLGGKASGPLSFMETWNTMGSVVVQGGKRRAALMGMLYSNHPDIEKFIDAKTEDGKLSYFNISIAIDNKFMEAVINDGVYELISPNEYRVVATVRARDLWDKICTSAHMRGDPGIFFIDIANADSLLKCLPEYYIETTNPCLSGDTLIDTIDGKKRIDEITINDRVLTMDIETKELMYENVEFSGCTKKNANLIELELEDGKILKLTPDHKVFTENRGYVEASQLNDDDLIVILE